MPANSSKTQAEMTQANKTPAEQILQRLLDLQDLLAQVNQAAIESNDAAIFKQTVCDLAIERGKLALAVIARPDDDGWFEYLAAAGKTAYLEGLRISAKADRPEGQGPAGRAWREGKPYFNTDFRSPILSPWHERAQLHGLRASVALPVEHQGRRYGVLMLYRGDDVVFSPQMQSVIVELALAISRGLDAIAERRLQTALLEHTPVAIAIARDRIIVAANTAMGRLFGYPAGYFVGQSTRLIYADEAEYLRVGLGYATLQANDHVTIPQVRARHQDGRELQLDVHGQKLDETSSVWTLIDQTQHLHLQGLYRALMYEGSILLTARNETELLKKTCAALVRETTFQTVWIGQPNDQNRIHPIATSSSGSADLASLDVYLDDPDHAAFITQAWKNQRIATCRAPDPESDTADRHAVCLDHQWSAALAAPVLRGGQPWGVICFLSSEPTSYDHDTLATCARIAELLGYGLDEIDLRARLIAQERGEAHRARHDLLTGLPNRLALTEYLPRAIARARRSGKAMAVGMMDLDDFKPVNDQFGHEKGDVLLKQLAQRLRVRLRDTDFLCRLGGDEFVLVLEGFDPAQIMSELGTALARLHQAVEQPFVLEESGGEEPKAEVGLTLGLALHPNDGDDPDALLRKADAALYQSKMRKANRNRWWRMHVDLPMPADEENIGSIDPFGSRSAAILRAAQDALGAVTGRFVNHWYAALGSNAEAATILVPLGAEELGALKAKQEAHLRFLLAPETTRAAIEEKSKHVGRVHALVGLTAELMIGFMEQYEALLRREWLETRTRTSERIVLSEVLSARLNVELRAQLRGYDSLLAELNAYLSKPLPFSLTSETWIDTLHEELSALGDIQGIAVAALIQPDDSGVFRFIDARGYQADLFLDALEKNRALPVLDPTSPYGQGSLNEVWRTGTLRTLSVVRTEPRLAPWHDVFDQMGVRSEAILPLLDRQGNIEAALLLMGTHPGQFGANWHRPLLESIQARFTTLWRARKQPQALIVEQYDARARREALFGGGLEMWMQPVVNLRTGQLAKVEALARLRMSSGDVIGPGGFLPLLGERDLRWLFDEGLRQSLAALNDWALEGILPALSINMPPSKLLNPKAPGNICSIVHDASIEPERVILEVLETEAIHAEEQNNVLDQLSEQGIKIAIDDLGSGYSSLLRLSTLPVSILKIDQGLVKDLCSEPNKRLPLIEALLGLGERLEMETVLEGLEDEGLIEMAVQMGADYGQGFGLARPMPAGEIPAWVKSFRLDVGSLKIRTPLGALAYHLRYAGSRDPALLVSVETCPLTSFIQEWGLSGSPLDKAHQALHTGGDFDHNYRIVSDGLGTLVHMTWQAKKD